MDFGKLLNVAQKNSDNGKKAEVKYYPAKFAPPKKEAKEKKLSDNIRKFLEKKEQEEKEKARQERQKRLELEAKRDPKMKRKIEKMLKVIKSANKSVLEDAVDHNDTAVTLQGPEQPDEDDYGYTSNVSDALYRQLMDKYKSMPEEKKFKDSVKHSMSKEQIAKAKERVRDTLNKIHEEESLPHKRQRKSRVHQDGEPYEPEVTPQREIEPEKKKEVPKKPKRPPGPPPMDFASLLKIAEQKQHQPIEVQVASKKKDEFERPMTKKERMELEERNKYLEEKKKRDMIRNNPELLAKAKAMAAAKNDSAQKMVPGGRIPKLNGSSSTSEKPILKSSNSKENGKSSNDAGPSTGKKIEEKTSKSKLETALTAPQKPSTPSSSKMPPSSKPSSTKPSSSSSAQKPIKDLKDMKSRPNPSVDVQKTRPTASTADVKKARQFPPPDVQKTRQFPPPDVQKTRQFPPPDVQKTRQFPPPDVISKKRQKEKQLQMLNKKRRIIDDDDDSEYDSEMDDFIDDEDAEVDFSAEIRNIFGYDKNRYRDEDFDDREMESNFAQQMREEYISKKIGIMEDLEDMRMEEEEKKRKAGKNKPKKR